MTVDEFLEKYNGRFVDFDGQFGYQCVDLFRQYCKDVLNIPHTGGIEGAKDLYLKYESLPREKKYFTRIKNKPATIPHKGDVVVFGSTLKNRWGHVAIVLSANLWSMKVFEQDGFKQTGAYVINRSYNNCLGFLRKREF